MEHTPTPWRHRAVSGGWDGVVAETGEEICRLSYNNPSNADFIATACNCHEALVSALERVKRDCIDEYGERVRPTLDTMIEVDDALKKAGAL